MEVGATVPRIGVFGDQRGDGITLLTQRNREKVQVCSQLVALSWRRTGRKKVLYNVLSGAASQSQVQIEEGLQVNDKAVSCRRRHQQAAPRKVGALGGGSSQANYD